MKNLDIEGINNDTPDEGRGHEHEENIKFSLKLVDYFSLLVKAFKEGSKETLTVNQLKKVYCHASRMAKIHEVKDINLHSLARIHMYLRLKSGDKMTTKATSTTPTKPTKLEIENPQKTLKISSFLDISESWVPSEGDFEKAEKEMDENDLKYEYNQVEDLYLEYEPIQPKWD
tara:strand:+ start:720 stop:1238 length:519 start_codon:yes stop_codon:yes gene_type:complete